MVLIHGFGACLGHWRHNIPFLCRHCNVYAIDLLGFGASAKPPSKLAGEEYPAEGVRYCIDLWAEQIAAFVDEVVISPRSAQPRIIHLIGNSIGGVVALNTALHFQLRGLAPEQVILIDCAQRLLDDQQLHKFPLWERLTRPFIKQLVRQRWLVLNLFRFLARPYNIRQVLTKAYPTGQNVDEELVQLLTLRLLLS